MFLRCFCHKMLRARAPSQDRSHTPGGQYEKIYLNSSVFDADFEPCHNLPRFRDDPDPLREGHCAQGHSHYAER